MAKFRKKPVEIQAVQLRWTQWNEVCELLGDALTAENPDGAWEIPADEASDTCGEEGPNYIALHVRTTHGETAIVRHGDWIIPEKEPGRFYPCKPDVFTATYEPSGTDQPARAAFIEIVEKDHSADGNEGVIVPNEVRINGTPLLIPAGEKIKVHSITLNENERGPQGEDAACVTLTLFARRVTIAAEADL